MCPRNISSLFYWHLYQKAAAQNLSQPQIAASSCMHGAGVGVGMLVTEGGKALGVAIFTKTAIGATYGGVIGAVVVGVGAAIFIAIAERKINRDMGIK
ncbi:MAG: hypothetical protein Q8O30_06235 [Candidatus Omnitrophota bacterium]|nr:hypothetical protein [Candidatus Omnitrophota bacterium]